MALQVVIIFVGKSAFHIINDGLTGTQWGITIGFSAITFVVSFIAKLIPLEILFDKFLSNTDTSEEQEEDKKSKDDIKEKGPDNSNNFLMQWNTFGEISLFAEKKNITF